MQKPSKHSNKKQNKNVKILGLSHGGAQVQDMLSLAEFKPFILGGISVDAGCG